MQPQHPGHVKGRKTGAKKPDAEAGVSLRQALQCLGLSQMHHGKKDYTDAVDQAVMAKRFLEEYLEKMR